MKKAILIPYRGTISDKSRLRSNLKEELLEKLLKQVTQNVINKTLQVKDVSKVYILTHKPDLEFQGNYYILKDKADELNSSILKALDFVSEEIIAIVMADLPLLTSTDIEEIFEEHIKMNKVVLAPTEDKGTSIICFDKVIKFPGVFGKNSSIRFQEFFEKNKVGFYLKPYNETYRDIDTFKDLIKIIETNLLPPKLQSIFKECVEFE